MGKKTSWKRLWQGQRDATFAWILPDNMPRSKTPTMRDENIDDEASYTCQSCGEEIVVPIDLLAGAVQEYVEDCPVCCRPHVLNVRIHHDGGTSMDVRAE